MLIATDPKPSKILGAYLPEPLAPHGGKFFGTPEVRVYRFSPTFEAFRASFKNTMFMYATNSEGFGVGGGDQFSIYIDDDLLGGSSKPCETFNSPALVDEEYFDIRVIELWQILI